MALVYLGQEDVDQFIQDDLELATPIEDEVKLEQFAKNYVFGKLQDVYDITGWDDASSTPSLVLTMMAMYFVGRIYVRNNTTREDEVASYGRYLMSEVDKLIDDLLNDRIELLEQDSVLTDDERTATSFQDSEAVFTMDIVI